MGEASEYPEDDWLALSGLQHYSFCKRQWALIHVEQLWSENARTTAGSLEHQRADHYENSETRGDLLVLRSLRVYSRQLGITGICDVVEFRTSPDGVRLQQREGTWNPYPIEYKHGVTKTMDADRLQLCAEAMCLEEMLACKIPEGALFYRQTRRREVVSIEDSLRSEVKRLLTNMHEMYSRGLTPRAKRKHACNACSLKDLCLPQLDRAESAKSYIEQYVYEDDVPTKQL
ncbi:MAG: CRISPR-associated protein Cas4 [Bifidobacterium psychraerophilum]|jgi:CRISPR-associated exonuclease Cas4|uniref:CRISPR-associated protein Cas4 n=1 Tax=Bifidobacterium psychraerophilum TaxID=218140 RepID=UPI0023F923B3|nr:CRISPR-associated protein Cas4 [Bifidobacterium psychraerophilum]MCI1659703.1 CRISPR-associated protein Cas4 [Bifidobacterium psychraerophilum]MCI2176834.1 CRISPR-associated protein Cas4 [Bifidobacterium psychraerophilum]MCI2182580.1 CRISPR-associated protein Cas4 [Bifidobacterium psychraerophilum]